MKQNILRVVMLGLFVLALIFVYLVLKDGGHMEKIRDTKLLMAWVQELGYWGPIIIIALMATAIVMNPIPSAPIALAAGAVYGHTWGTVYVVLGALIGALAAFGIARKLGYDLMHQLLGKRLKSRWMGTQNVMTAMVFTSRLIPFLSFDLVSYGAGLTPIKTWRFTAATLFGLIPASFMLAHFGAELSTSNLNTAMLILLFLGVITLVPIAITILVRWSKQRFKH